MSKSPSRFRKAAVAVSLVTAGVIGGGVLATTVGASADVTSPSSSTSQGDPANGSAERDESKSMRPDEQLLTGSDAEKATAAALAKYPGATIQRVETDSDGVYEAHLVTADGQRLIVQMDAGFTVTGTDDHGGPGHGPRSEGGTSSPAPTS